MFINYTVFLMPMDPHLSDAIQAVAYSTAAGVGIYATAQYYTHKIKTAAERLRAKTEHLAAVKEALNDPNYKSWLEKRTDFGNKIIEAYPEVGNSEENLPEKFRRTLDAVVGPNPLNV